MYCSAVRLYTREHHCFLDDSDVLFASYRMADMAHGWLICIYYIYNIVYRIYTKPTDVE